MDNPTTVIKIHVTHNLPRENRVSQHQHSWHIEFSVVGDCLVHYGMPNSIPDLYVLDASSTYSSTYNNHRCLQTLSNVPERRNHPGWEPLHCCTLGYLWGLYFFMFIEHPTFSSNISSNILCQYTVMFYTPNRNAI